MCELILANSGDEELNKLLVTVASFIGSREHSDGWGFVTQDGEVRKSNLPAYITSNYGEQFENVNAGNFPILGHIRKASPRIPVTVENAHPFNSGNVFFAHNGKLSPKKEDDFELEYEVEVETTDLKGEKKVEKKKYQHSDSLLFFTELMKDGEFESEDSFIERLQKTMDKFYGKFAFLFYMKDTKNYYVVRGKTANLNIMEFFRDPECTETIGFLVDTSEKTLNQTANLVSNIYQLQTGRELYYTFATEIPQETILRINGKSLEKVGELKENPTPVRPYAHSQIQQFSNYYSGNFTEPADGEMYKLMKTFIPLCNSLHLTPVHVQYIFLVLYGKSLLDVTTKDVDHFNRIVAPRLFSSTDKDMRKKIRNAPFFFSLNSTYMLNNFQFPWMLNSTKKQQELVRHLSEKLM